MIYDFKVMSKVIEELREKIMGGMISRIQQKSDAEIIIGIKSERSAVNLLISANSQRAGFYITEEKLSEIINGNFVLLLRKYILNGKIISIEQVPMERILKIGMKARDDIGNLREYIFVIEVMGKHSNIILTEEGKIVDSIKHINSKVNSFREILPGEMYIYPPIDNKRNPKTDEEIFTTIFLASSKEEKIESILINNFSGTSMLWAREIMRRCNIKEGTKAEDIGEEDVKLLYRTWIDGWTEQRGKILLYLSKDEQKSPWETPLAYHGELKLFEGFPFKEFTGINEALDYGYRVKIRDEKKKNEKNGLLAKLKEKKKKLLQGKKKAEAELEKSEKAEGYRKKGEILIANLQMQIREDNNIIELDDIYSEEISKITIEINPKISMSQNAQNYFKKYKKASQLKENSLKSLEETEQEMEYIENLILSVEMCNNISEIEEIKEELCETGIIKEKKAVKKEKEKSEFMTFTSPDGWEIFVGKNTTQNDRLTMKTAKGNDIWLHAKGMPGSHVVIRNAKNVDMGQIPPRTLFMAAQLAAYNSRGKNSSQVLVDYTQRKYVKKPKGAKPGMVIYHGEKSIYVSPKQ